MVSVKIVEGKREIKLYGAAFFVNVTMNRISMRKKYISRFLFRCIAFAAVFVLSATRPEIFSVCEGNGFFRELTLLHVLWVIWMCDMFIQLVPSDRLVSVGSQKNFTKHYVEREEEKSRLREFVKRENKSAGIILLIWIGVIIGTSILKGQGIIETRHVVVMMTFFYLSDLICVLFWCPFRVFIMKNRCCITCRIFNWDHMMMFFPGICCVGFFSWSLCLMAVAVFVIWEITFAKHPERFYDGTNCALTCANCKEHLCGKK